MHEASRATSAFRIGIWRWSIILACLGATAALGVIKVERQRASPPSYAQKEVHQFDGFVSIDGFSHRAQAIRNWLSGVDDASMKPSNHPGSDLHPTSWTIPIVVGLLSCVTDSVPRTFQGLSIAALLAQLLLVMALAQRTSAYWPRGIARSSPTFLTGVMFVSHCLTIRTAGQLILDPFCACLALAVVLLAQDWIAAPSVRRGLAISALMIAGMFTKVSFLPMFVAPIVLAALAGAGLGIVMRLSVFSVVLPALPVLAFFVWVADESSAAVDFKHLIASWTLSLRELKHFAFEMVLLVQLWPLVLLVAAKPSDRKAQGPIVLAIIVLLATWAMRLPAVPRLYLPVWALAAPVLGNMLATSPVVASRAGVAAVAFVVLGNYAVGVIGLFSA